MTRQEKQKIQDTFLKKAGPNVAAFKVAMDTLPDVAFYMTDARNRLMAANRRNCELCNIRDELDAVGRRIADLFPNTRVDEYIRRDAQVRETGRPIVAARKGQFNLDRTKDMHVSSVFPLFDSKGSAIGTFCLYFKTSETDNPQWHEALKPIAEHIDKHFAEPISINCLAKMAKTSLANFQRQFTRIFGIPPGRYITAIRLNAARKLLETTDKLVSEIAAETGFWDQSHFTKQFRRERGITPGEYRRRHRALVWNKGADGE